MRRSTLFVVSTVIAGFVACSDDDGSNIVPNGPPGSGGGGTGGTTDAGPGGTGGSTAGTGGGSTAGTAGTGGSGGSAGCTPVSVPDGGVDAGTLDAGSGDAGLDASTDGPPSGVISFESDVHPIFAASCGPCHVTDGSAGHNVGGADVATAYDQAVGIGQRLVVRVDGGGMPPSYADPPNDCGGEGRGDQPGDPGCLTVAEVALIQTWIDQCYPR